MANQQPAECYELLHAIVQIKLTYRGVVELAEDLAGDVGDVAFAGLDLHRLARLAPNYLSPIWRRIAAEAWPLLL